MLAIQVPVVAWGYYLQHRAGSGASVLPQDLNVAPLYVSVLVLEWGLLALVRRGVNARGIKVWELAGVHRIKAKDVLRDVAIGISFLVVAEWAARILNSLMGPYAAKSIQSILPRSTPEVVLWIAISVSAGICEEIVYRGYFQKQFAAYTNSVAAAVVLQGVVFGVAHAYQGLHQVIIIAMLGMLYGCLAAWRKNLRANMIAHAASDIWSGWLIKVLR